MDLNRPSIPELPAVLRTDGQASAPGPMSLQTILDYQVTLHWSEAVAIIAELCQVLGPGGSYANASIPGPADAAITSEGGIVLRFGARGENTIASVARTLNALLDGANPPAPLRLFVLSAISPDAHDSIRAFGAALTYYERPGRAALIQDVHQRVSQMVADRAHQQPDGAVVPEPAPDAPARESRRRRPPMWMVVALGLGAGTVAAAIAWTTVGGRTVSSASNPVNGLIAQAGAAAQKVTETVRERLGIGPSVDDTASAEAPATTPAAAPPRPRGSRPRQRAADATPPQAPQVPLADRAPETSGQSGAGVSRSNTTVSGVSDDAAFDDPSVYSSASTDVEPPVLVDPQLPPRSPDRSTAPVNRMELLISEDGAVQRIRFLETPTRLPDMMVLSAAKTWRFRPALKDGRPVRFRMTLDWTAP